MSKQYLSLINSFHFFIFSPHCTGFYLWAHWMRDYVLYFYTSKKLSSQMERSWTFKLDQTCFESFLAIFNAQFPLLQSFWQTILSRYLTQCLAQCQESTRFSIGVCRMVVNLLDKQDWSEILGEGQGKERKKQLCSKGQAVLCMCLVCWLI